MLTVCVSSTDDVYATTGDAMLALFGSTTTGNVTTTQEIDYLGRLVTRASRWADKFVGRPLAQQVYSESLAGQGVRRMTLARHPLVKVLRFFDSTSTGDATAICSTDFRVESYDSATLSRDAGWQWTADLMSAETCHSLGLVPAWRPGELDRPWLAEYVAGFRVAGTTSTANGLSTADETWTTGPTVPDDLVQAVAVRAAELYANPLGVASRSVGDLSVQYRRVDGTPSAAEAMLEPYRKGW